VRNSDAFGLFPDPDGSPDSKSLELNIATA
jgi:hypothetical protein